jgi:predicted nucleic acid-binding protein
MIVISDTSPLNYLILIESTHVLPALFQHVYVPERVAIELQSADAPELVRNWISLPPAWLISRAPVKIDPTLRLDPGETDAISLAQEFRADHLLIDEWAGRAAAQLRGLHVIGTLGVLVQAAEENLVDLKTAFSKLAKTTFRADQKLLDQLLADSIARKRNS